MFHEHLLIFRNKILEIDNYNILPIYTIDGLKYKLFFMKHTTMIKNATTL